MNEQMEFPETWEEYEQEYGFNDSDEVYTNNSRLIQSFRVKQWLDHLEQEPCDDMVSRGVFDQVRWERDVAIGQLKELGYEFGEKIEPSEDTISRQAVLASIKNLYPDMPIVDIFGARRKWLEKYAPYFECENAIEQLPPVTPQPNTGHWIRGKERHFLDTRTNLNVEMKEATGKGYHTYINAQCSKCRMITIHDDSILYQYCPHCGARMFEPQESEG